VTHKYDPEIALAACTPPADIFADLLAAARQTEQPPDQVEHEHGGQVGATDLPDEDELASPPEPRVQFSPQQDQAMAAVRDWLTLRDRPVFRLFGFAGTGKTTLAKSLAATVKGGVYFAAYTGKAAAVMRRKGCGRASTIHQLIYKPLGEDDEKVATLRKGISDPATDVVARIEMRRQLDELLKPKFEFGGERTRRAKLIVIDECSMVDEVIGRDLLRLGVPILVLGDPAQLPPVAGAGFFTNQAPDVLLDEIHRQAEGSGILQLATRVRQQRTTALPTGVFGDEQSCVHPRHAIERDCDPLWFDQVLVGTHKTRRAWNTRIRQQLGRQPYEPVPGDKLVAMKNAHQHQIMNGEIWNCRDVVGIDRDRITLTVEADDEPGKLRTVTAIRHYFQGREEELKLSPVPGAQFDFGYALTVHKAQGSQWQKVLLVNEGFAFRRDPDTPWRWLYTGITRAAQTVVVAQ
jgi:exodeoxyribonuclease-5